MKIVIKYGKGLADGSGRAVHGDSSEELGVLLSFAMVAGRG